MNEARKETISETNLKQIDLDSNSQEYFEFSSDRKIKEFKFSAYREQPNIVEDRRKTKKTSPNLKSETSKNTANLHPMQVAAVWSKKIISTAVQTITLICLLIITLCSVAFIYFEYQPDSSFRATPIAERTAQVDPKCLSDDYTDLYKRRFLNCK